MAASFNLASFATNQKYNEICRIRWNRTYNLSRFDQDWNALRKGHYLELRHIQELFDKRHTHFGHFWEEPSNLPQALSEKPISLALSDDDASGGNNERALVERLFCNLGSMEPASILLRCIHPDRFGVYSPPILSFLQIPLSSPVQHYLHFCRELREWKEHFKLSSIGDTDRALWVFYEYAYGPKHVDTAASARAEFEKDEWIQERQAFNVLHRFLKSYSTIKQASFLAAVDPSLAGKVAGCHFERVLRNCTGQFDPQTPIADIINHYVRLKNPPPSTKGALWKIWRLRCATIHSHRELSEAQAKEMIKEINTRLPPLAP